MRKFIVLLLALALTLSFTACNNKAPASESSGVASQSSTGSATEPDVVKVAFLFPLTGAAASVGEDARKGFDLAVNWINNNGGIEKLGGAKIKAIYADTQSDEEAAATEAERLIENEGVIAIVGCYQSAVTLPVRAVCEKYGCPLLICCASSDTLTDSVHEWSFRVHETNSSTNTCQMNFIKSMRDGGTEIKTAALMYENSDWGQGLSDLWFDAFDEIGIKIVVDETFASDASDVSTIVTKLANSDPDIVMCAANFDAMVLLTNTMVGKSYAPNLLMCASGGEQDSDFIPTVGNNADGFLTAMGWGIDVLAAKSDKMWIADEYTKANNGESFTGESAAGWSDAFLLRDALNIAAKLDRTALRDALANIVVNEDEWWNIYPYAIEFNENGQNFHAITPIGQFQDASVKIIWPESSSLEGVKLVVPGSDLSVLKK